MIFFKQILFLIIAVTRKKKSQNKLDKYHNNDDQSHIWKLWKRIMYEIFTSSYREEWKGNKDFNATNLVTMIFFEVWGVMVTYIQL